jgi:hypothetical protein
LRPHQHLEYPPRGPAADSLRRGIPDEVKLVDASLFNGDIHLAIGRPKFRTGRRAAKNVKVRRDLSHPASVKVHQAKFSSASMLGDEKDPSLRSKQKPFMQCL